MMDFERTNDSVYGDNLEDAKMTLKLEVHDIVVQILQEYDRARQFAHLLKHFDDLSIGVSRDSLLKDQEETLKFGLDADDSKGEHGFVLELTADEAREIRTSMKPESYAALCEEGLIRQIGIYEQIASSAYKADIEKLKALLEFVQTATDPMQIVNRIKMWPER